MVPIIPISLIFIESIKQLLLKALTVVPFIPLILILIPILLLVLIL